MNSIREENGIPVLGIVFDKISNGGFVGSSTKNIDPIDSWNENVGEEGKLAVDVAETEKDVIIVSAIAGASLDKIEIHLHNDLLTIRGKRHNPLNEVGVGGYFYQECFWGNFSRSVVLPVETRAELARAEYKNGILCVIIPKRKVDTQIPVLIVED